ncbi:aspartyl-phosphate phosphatase Spo0E family protein [Virgibacillus necropolis]|uniref:aspartyl-phosphate phosphatase Spo0E family protein n=1 Tax=Virgibacillus necropolis TaxID=163877 RepID=UPI0038505B3C
MKNEEKLLKHINKKRQVMIRIGMVDGMTSKEAIKCSQELDYLLNLYMKISLKSVA